jgi:hypothetical protein
MSLAVLADHMASKGRGGDSMLIHMAPSEIKGLQALAVANGSSLTINPDTGLPEALSLKKLLPAIIGFGITAMTGIPAWQVGLGVGAVETARTGDLGKGISAGLGAYGGAGLGAGFSTAGAEAIGSEAAGQSYLSSYAPPGVLEGAGVGLSADMAYNLGQAGVVDAASTQAASAAQQAAAERIAAASPFERMSAGFDAAKANPSSLLTKDNAKYLMAAAAPVLADQAVKSNLPTTTTKPGMIRPYSYDPYGGTYTAGSPYEAQVKSAANGGLMGMDNGGYSPGQLDFTQQSEPVMRMAEGGVPGYANGMLVGDQDVFNYFKGLDQSKLASGALDAQIAADMQKYNVGAADIGRITGTQANQGDFEKRFVQAINPATLSSADFLAKTADVGLTDQALANAMKNAGMSQAAQYAATHQLNDAAGITEAPTSAQNLYNSIGYKAGDLKGDAGGIAGMYANISGVAGSLQDKINSGALTVAQAQNLSLAEMDRLGINQADIKGATGKDFGNLFTAKAVVPTCGFGMQLNKAGTACEPIVCGAGFQLNKAGTACEAKVSDTIVGGTGNDTIVGGGGNDTIVTKGCPTGFHKSADGLSCVPNAPVLIDWKDCGTGYHWDKAQQLCVKNIDATQNTTTTVDTSTGLITAPATALPVGVAGNTGASIFGGGSTVNPNGTITTSPVIPGIPVGGFTGMEQVRDAYEKGGGSLGVNKNLFVPKTQDELFARYKNTGGSKAAFDYLMGKTPYSPVPVTPTGEIMKPYFESVGRAPINLKAKKYIYDPETRTYKDNPAYVKPSYVQAGEKAAALTNQDKEPTESPGAGNKWTWNSTDKKWEAKPIDDSSGGGSKNNVEDTSYRVFAGGGLAALTMAGGGSPEQFNLGGYSDGGRLLRGPGDGVSDSIPATIGNKRPARLADGEFVVPARIVSELGNGSTEAGARKLYAMMDRVQAARKGSIGKGKVAKNSRADKYLPA